MGSGFGFSGSNRMGRKKKKKTNRFSIFSAPNTAAIQTASPMIASWPPSTVAGVVKL